MKTEEESKYQRAKKKVKEIKGFYSHLTVYVVINVLLICMHLGVFHKGILELNIPSWSMFTTPFFWGIGLTAHGLHVFQDRFRFLRQWEERKIQQILKKEEDEMKRTTRDDVEF
ncbi:2TM domain-containing protein [Constantimarinum furrinae]|uniref:2TM domain-containing protein n=1 Tax=Constantimarinum furrinae TaxID=2562285 RepID=A0A7G8PVU2_9FLAO|nr:2TM domain-containing protein [Constantimarinum furrinae]QNJ98458.1 hypothetical protein ALE3EI_1911 [Constantimarinum furrinae]